MTVTRQNAAHKIKQIIAKHILYKYVNYAFPII